MTLTHDQETLEPAPTPYPNEDQVHGPGIYFHMPAEVYHNDPSFHSGAMGDILHSELCCWIRSRHLNSDWEESDTEAQRKGKVFHAFVYERGGFGERYYWALDPENYPDALRTVEQLKEALAARGEKTKGRKSELTEQLALKYPEVEIWDLLVEKHRGEHAATAEEIDASWRKDMEFRRRLIMSHTDARRCFSQGWPEVSIFWRDPRTGCPLKARIDYLKVKAITDLKNFANQFNIPSETAFIRGMIQYRSDIQAVLYWTAVQKAKALELPVLDGGEEEETFWAECMETVQHTYHFVAVQSGEIPNVLVFRFVPSIDGQEQTYWDGALSDVRRAIDTYRLCLETWGTDIWINAVPVRPLRDPDFPSYHLERIVG